MNKTSIVCTCVFSFVLNLMPAVSTAEPLQIPPDYKVFAYRVGFVRALADKCDSELHLYGASHEHEVTCQNFLSQADNILETMGAYAAAWEHFTIALARSPQRSLRAQWNQVVDQVTDDLYQMAKTMHHIKFQRDLRQTATEPPVKSSTRR
jgi:hypothetical protein